MIMQHVAIKDYVYFLQCLLRNYRWKTWCWWYFFRWRRSTFTGRSIPVCEKLRSGSYTIVYSHRWKTYERLVHIRTKALAAASQRKVCALCDFNNKIHLLFCMLILPRCAGVKNINTLTWANDLVERHKCLREKHHRSKMAFITIQVFILLRRY